MLLIRVIPLQDYGALVTWIAFLEIYYLLSGFGLGSIAQRYLPDLNARGKYIALNLMVRRLIALRILTALILSLVVSLFTQNIGAFIGATVTHPYKDLWQFAIMAVFLFTGVLVRHLDEILGSLLMQGLSQVLGLFRNLFKLAVTVLLFRANGNLALNEFLVIETVSASLAMLWALWSVLGRVKRKAISLAHDETNQSEKESDGRSGNITKSMWRVAWQFYAVQVIGQIYGPNAIKIVVSRTLGLDVAAAYGFIAALVDMIRNYLPAHLLSTWVRPIMVSRYIQSGSINSAALLGRILLKINLIGILVISVIFISIGDKLIMSASGGKFNGMSSLFLALMLLLALQTTHLLIGMLALVLERGNANIVATLLACTSLPVGILGAHQLGAIGVVLGVVLGELLWIVIVWVSLIRGGSGLVFDWISLFRLTMIACAGIGTAAAGRTVQSIGTGVEIMISLAILVVLLFIGKPFAPVELDAMRAALRFRIPARG